MVYICLARPRTINKFCKQNYSPPLTYFQISSQMTSRSQVTLAHLILMEFIIHSIFFPIIIFKL